jgi:large repetitive protein
VKTEGRSYLMRIVGVAILAFLPGGLLAQIPPPQIVSITPNIATAGGGVPIPVTVGGSGFVPNGTSLLWPSPLAPIAIPAVYVSATQVTAQIPSNLITVPGVYQLKAATVGGTSFSSVPFTVAPQLQITSITLPSAQVGVAYSQRIPLSGGVPPYSWSVILDGPGLPPGFSLNPQTGEIFGTAATQGQYSFLVSVTDSGFASISSPIVLAVGPGPVSITTALLPPVASGDAYSQTLAARGGVPPYTWSLLGPGPPGLTLNASTGTLSGNAGAPGFYTFSVQASDSARGAAIQSLSLRITSTLAITTPQFLPSGVVGVTYLQTVRVSGGLSPYSWSVSAGDLPPGIALNQPTGDLSGTPTADGTYNFTVLVTDQNQVKVSQQFTLVIGKALSIATSTLPGGNVDFPYAAMLVATGGAPPFSYSWAITAGTLPSGLTLNANTGAITGTPSVIGSSAFTAEVTHFLPGVVNGQLRSIKVSKDFTIVISPPKPTIDTQTLSAATAGTVYSQPLTASGGTPPYAWSISAGALPAGLSLNATDGSISGTPTAGGPARFTVQITDAAQVTATRAYTLAVAVPALPAPTFTGLTDTVAPAQQPVLGLALATPFPLAITGEVKLSFTPEPGDPAVQFSTGGRTLTFTTPPGQTGSILPANTAIQTGTVAGTITLTASLQSGGVDVTPTPAPTRTITIGRLAPSLTTVKAVRTAGGIEIQITGFSTPREVTQATFRFTFSNGQTSSDVTVPLSSIFTTWYKDPASAQFGSGFKYVQPFSVQGDTTMVTSVQVTLTNSVGSSQGTGTF